MKLSTRLLQLHPAARRYHWLTVGLGAVASLLVVAQAMLLSRAIGRVFLGGQALAEVAPLLLWLALLAAARAALTWGAEISAQRLASLVKRELRARLARQVLALGPAYASGERSGELSNTLGEGVEALDEYLAHYLPQLMLAGLVPAIVLALVFPLDWLSGLVLLLTAPIIPVFMILIGGMAKRLSERQWTELSRLSAHFLDMLQGLTTLKLFGRSRDQAATIGQVSASFGQATLRVLRVAFLSALVLELTASLSTAIVAVEVALRLLRGGLLFEQALALLILAPEFYLPLRLLGARHHASMTGVEAAKRIFSILEIPLPNHQDAKTPRDTRSLVPWRLGGESFPNADIHFENVSFAYDGGARPALRGLSLTIRGGETVALVGPSGAGKSTVAHLLLRFSAPDSGAISVAGRPLESLDPAAWREQVAWVPQRPYLLNASVAENLRLARPAASIEQIVAAAEAAGIHASIAALPQGYDTPVGERGARLSGGEVQRLALARAFLKDAPLLILDEPTAQIDPEHEQAIRASIARLGQGRTVLLIAHRLGLAADADRVVVLDHGRVIEQGPPAELLARSGGYRKLLTAYAGRRTNTSYPVALPPPSGLRSHAASAGEGAAFHALQQPAVRLRAGQPRTPSRSSAATREASRHSDGASASSGSAEMPAATMGDKRSAAGRLAAGEEARAPQRVRRMNSGSLWRLLKLIAPVGGWFALAALLGFATIGSSVGLIATSAYLIAKAALAPSIAELQLAIVGVRFFGIARGVLRYLERYAAHTATFRVLARLRVWLYQAVEPLAPAGLMRFRSGDLLTRMVADIDTLEQFFIRAIAPPIVAVLVGGVACMLLGLFDARLALALLAALLLAGAVLPLLTLRLSRRPGQRIVGARAELNAALLDGVQGVADLLAFGQAERHQAELDRLGERLARAQERMAAIRGMHGALAGLLASLAGLALLAIATPLVRGARLDGVYLALIVLTAGAAFEAVAPLSQAAQHLSSSLAAARRLFAIADSAPPVQELAGRSPTPLHAGLEVRDLSFAYPSAERQEPSAGLEQPVLGSRFLALDRVGFRLRPGGRLAIVGASGAGKSTLLQVLLRFWEYQRGQIWLGGRDLRSYRADDLRKLIGVVSQQTHLFNATIRENLWVARPGASQDEIAAAASQAQIDRFIHSLPQGYDTWVGEGGLRLSGGERQRLAIARAFLKDAPLLFLDEPTANLDAIAERAIMRSLGALMARPTTLLITHRLVGLEHMDSILVLSRGRVVEQGTHHDLLKLGGYYRRMWEQQHASAAPAGHAA